VLQAATPNVVPNCNDTQSFVRLVVGLRALMTTKDIARYLGVSETMIRGIEKVYLTRNFGKPRLKHLKVLAIDGSDVGKAQKFLTIVTADLECGDFAGDERGATKRSFAHMRRTPEFINSEKINSLNGYCRRAVERPLL